MTIRIIQKPIAKKELTRLRELFCGAVLGGKEYNTKLKDLERYFFYFALYSQKQAKERR